MMAAGTTTAEIDAELVIGTALLGHFQRRHF
jgi:hypothetical protein